MLAASGLFNSVHAIRKPTVDNEAVKVLLLEKDHHLKRHKHHHHDHYHQHHRGAAFAIQSNIDIGPCLIDSDKIDKMDKIG